MKKISAAVLSFVIFVYALPIITLGIGGSTDADTHVSAEGTHTPMPDPFDLFSSVLQDPDTKDDEVPENVDYDEKNNVSVLIDGTVKNITIREYLIGVVAAEMPASFPIEALKAQAVAARSYMLHKIENQTDVSEHNGAQLCDDHTHCTAYFDIEASGAELWGDKAEYYGDRIKAAVTDTDGIVAVSNGKVIAAVFHSASADMTEAAVNVWGTDYPYLVSVSSVGGNASPAYYGTVVVGKTDFCSKIKENYPNAVFAADCSKWISGMRRSQSGGVLEMVVGGVLIKGTEIRSMFSLNSTNFKIEMTEDEVVFTTVGTGHGVGMSQFGAREMALNGAYFDEIICHYYSGVQLMVKN